MAVHASHAALPYPVKNARWSVLLPYLDADGDPTAPTTPDTEISKDNAAAADCAEEASATSGMDGMALITLTGAETDCSCLALNAKVASGPKATLITVFPRVLPAIFSGTATAGASGSITLATDVPAIADILKGCLAKTTGGTGGGGTGGANNQARVITGYTTGRVASVTPNWETNPDNTTTYEILLTENAYMRLADLQLWRSSQPNALTSGRVEVLVGAVTNGVIAAASFAANALDAVWSVAARVLTAATNITSTGGTTVPQTGDSFARLGAPVGASISADIASNKTDLTSLLARLTPARSGYLDNLNVSGLVASSAEATAIQNNTRVVRVVPDVIERPDSGTTTYRIEVLLYDDVGNMEIPDSAPTIALVNQAGTDRSSRLDSSTMALVSTGRYRAIYTADVGDTLEQLIWAFSVVEGGATRIYGNASLIVDTSAVDFTAADRAKLDTLHDTRLTASRATALDNLDATVSSRLATTGYTAPDNATISTINTNVSTLLTRIPAALFSGITSLAQWLGLIAGKQTGNSTARTELRATGAGSGAFDETTDSQEALRDRGDAAWTTATGFPSSADYTTARAAKLDNLDAAISTRATPTQVNIEADLALADAGVTTVRTAKLDNLPEGIKKNQALANFEFEMVDSADHVTAKTGLTITAQRSIDGGAYAACTNSASEVGSGTYKITLAAADLNGDVITLKFTGTGADATKITLKTSL